MKVTFSGNGKSVDESVNFVMDCLDKKDHMTIFQLDSSDSAREIDEIILHALLKG